MGTAIDRNYRVGIGHDIHRLAAGCKLMLGGIEIPHSHGLQSHSDGDVVLHAVCDAMLGAAGLGDIGEHFPDTDAGFKGMASSVFLKEVYEKIRQAGWSVDNVDVVILAQAPKLKEFKPKMKYHMARQLSIEPSRVNVKAGTNEGFGPVGAGEAIAAYAVVLLTGPKK
jgi:2-C-methyl-D-erythritol 2,4-cyclodiphosphate synthase